MAILLIHWSTNQKACMKRYEHPLWWWRKKRKEKRKPPWDYISWFGLQYMLIYSGLNNIPAPFWKDMQLIFSLLFSDYKNVHAYYRELKSTEYV